MIRSLTVASLLLCAFQAKAAHIFTPESLDNDTARILIVIHGCMQSPSSMAYGTGFHDVAEKENLLLVFPSVPKDSHPADCWAWWKKENLKPNSGQIAYLNRVLKKVQTTHHLQKNDVYVTGISSGSGIAANWVACHPEKFAGAAFHSGPPYGLVNNEKDAAALAKEGPTKAMRRVGPCDPAKFTGKILAIQGMQDKVVHHSNGRALLRGFFPNAQTTSKSETTGNRKLTITEYIDSESARGKLIEISDMGHVWRGLGTHFRKFSFLKDKTAVPFFETTAPSSTDLISEFLF